MAAAALAAALAVVAQLLGWHGVDTAAQAYRIAQFHLHGLRLWDPGWYGGHWTLDYSVLYPPMAATLGEATVTILSAAAAALAFDRLARDRLGPGGRPASLVFAAGTLVPAAIGQLPFLAGAAFGLSALWAARERRAVVAGGLTAACTLTSPLTGAFAALALAAWLVGARGRRRGGGPTFDRETVLTGGALIAVALVPVLAGVVLFPGDGPMPYPATDWVWEMVVAAVVALAATRQPHVRAGALLWMPVATASVLIPSSLGGNVGRIEDLVALPLAVGMLWSRLPLLAATAAVPLALSQWSPAWGAITVAAATPSTHAAYYAPLQAELGRLAAAGPPGRVEAVPTRYHWESVYLPAVMPLARGWERQLDVADDPIFYRPGPIPPTAYRAWLVDNGVRFVALPDAPLDQAGRAEAALIRSGLVPGLDPVWHDRHWTLYTVAGSPGIVSGPARLVRAAGRDVTLDATAAGTVTVRVRYSPGWSLAGGPGCVRRSDGSWLEVTVPAPGPVRLHLDVLGAGPGGCDRQAEAGAVRPGGAG